MTGRRIAIGAVGALAGILLLGGLVWAANDSICGADGSRGAGRWVNTRLGRFIHARIERLRGLRDELNITDEQRGKIKEIVQKHRDKIAPAVKKIMDERQALRKAVLAKDADEAAIRKAAADLGNSIGEAAVLFSKAAGEARPVLTTEQIERLEKFLSERGGAGDKWLQQVSAGK